MTTDLTAWFLSAAAFAIAMVGTPGPNNAMVAASGATFGFARTFPHMLGIAFGFPLMLLALALGAGTLLRDYPLINGVLKWAGAAYLLWLAVRIARAEPRTEPGTAAGRPMTFIGAALFQWINPKAWFIAASAMATFTDGPARATLLAAIFAVITLPLVGFWTLTGVGAARVLRTPGGLRAFNIVMAALLVASILPVLLEAAPSGQ